MTTPGRRPQPVMAADAFAPVGFGDSEPTRYVGGTTSGAPTVGVFEAGDFAVAHDGGLFVCTVGGEPGTWVGGRAVTINGDQTIDGVKRFNDPPVVSSIQLDGLSLDTSGGALFLNGRRLAFTDELDHSHGGTTGAASTGTAHTHPVTTDL